MPKKAWSVFRHASVLLDTLKTFPEQPLTFTVEDNHTVEISSNSGKYALAYADGEDFQKPSNWRTFLHHHPEIFWLRAISKTIFAAGNDDLRPVMSGVFFQFSTEGLTFVATDAHKLVKYTRSDVQASQNGRVHHAQKPLNLIKGILAGSEEDVTVEYNDSNAKFSFSNTELVCRLIDGKYPNYEAVIPKENPNKLTIDRNHSSIRCAGWVFSAIRPPIKYGWRWPVPNWMFLLKTLITATRPTSALPVITRGWHPNRVQFPLLTEMLGNLTSDAVTFGTPPFQPCGYLNPVDGLDQGEEILMLVMPVMLNT